MIIVYGGCRVMVINATFNNISTILWWSVLFVEETGVPGENHDLPQVNLSHNSINCIEYTSSWAGFELTTLVVIGTDCIGSYKSNYHAIMTMMALGVCTVTVDHKFCQDSDQHKFSKQVSILMKIELQCTNNKKSQTCRKSDKVASSTSSHRISSVSIVRSCR